MDLQSWGEVFTQSLLNVWEGLVAFLPDFLIALAILIIGWILATLVEKIIEGVFRTMKIDNFLRSAGVDEVVERTGHKLNSGKFIGSLVKWFILIVFLMAFFDRLGLLQVNLFLKDVVLYYLPQVIIAVLILMVAVVIADAVHRLVIVSARAAHIKSAALLANIAKWAIWIFAVLSALIHLRIAPSLLITAFTGIVAAAAIAAGLAFGLGGRDVASRMLEKMENTLTEKE